MKLLAALQVRRWALVAAGAILVCSLAAARFSFESAVGPQFVDITGQAAIGFVNHLGRNSLRTNPFRNLDLSLTRRFPIRERTNIEFRADAFNISNSVIFGQPNNTLGNSNFGLITGTANGAANSVLYETAVLAGDSSVNKRVALLYPERPF